jgi:23S rRNA pseudouridine1911/1915/1917 synthase
MEHAGRRLDQSLAELTPEYSRSRIASWIDAGLVVLDGKPASRKQKLWGGEAVVMAPEPPPEESAFRPEAIDLDLVYEDDHILVINKPAGLVTHPGAGNWEGTLLNALLHHTPSAAGLARAGIVHRLDKDTSGLMVAAKTLPAQTQLVRDLQARGVKRVYWAVARGLFDHVEGEIDAPIGRHPTQRTRMAVVESGKPALTYWRVLNAYSSCAWMECRLATGRTHQIRVHMAHIGHPLIGDPVYGGKPHDGLPTFHRQALHAVRLGLQHPITGEAMEWEVPPPLDFQEMLVSLEKQR